MVASATITVGAGVPYSTRGVGAAIPAGVGARYSATGAGAAIPAGAGVVYSTSGTGAAVTAGAAAMCFPSAQMLQSWQGVGAMHSTTDAGCAVTAGAGSGALHHRCICFTMHAATRVNAVYWAGVVATVTTGPLGRVLRHWHWPYVPGWRWRFGHTLHCEMYSVADAGAAYPAGAGATHDTAGTGAMVSSTGLAGAGAMHSTTSSGTPHTTTDGATNATTRTGAVVPA